MLINFRTENFLSFESAITLSLTLGKTKSHEKNILKGETIDLLKFSAIYGANASGKSNLVTAIGVSKEIIVQGLDGLIVSDSYNKNNPENIHKETKFEYEILLNNRMYSYGFSINLYENSIVKEWLYDITGEEISVFTRHQDVDLNFDYLEMDADTQNRIAVYAKDIVESNSSLFLTFINKNRIKIDSRNSVLSEIFRWFSESLEVISPEDVTSDFGLTYHSETYLNKLGDFLQANDTGITKVLFEKSDEKLRGIPDSIERRVRAQMQKDLESKTEDKNGKIGAIIRLSNNIYKFQNDNGEINMYVVKFLHGDSKTKYRFDEESDGTRRLIELFSIVSNLKDNKVFIVDELDRSFHPLLTLNFVNSFLSNSASCQLVVTTHEDRLLDLSILRRDQIWFVRKDSVGNSSLYSLEEFKERFDKNIMNAYLNGRYGATPKIINFFPSLNNVKEDA